MPLAPGTRLGPYEVVSPLGAGGMGEVYRARDSRLGRDVALKLLSPELTREAGRLERFDREARAIAALNHPHIVTIYSTENVDGVRFLTMELVEGQTLTDLIVPGGINVTRFLDIAVPLADALTAAHQKQITHRDLKPSNVMLSHDGRVKVLDFGLARIGTSDVPENSLAATRAPVTQRGMIVGTMPYMSPEQVEGEPLDTRSDLFSLGVIFYELLTGERPFLGASSPALMSAILRDTPPPVSAKRGDVPDALTRLVSRCLEKRREDRVQTARDVYNELRQLQQQLDVSGTRRGTQSRSGVTPLPSESLSIAVLPFSVRGTDPEADAIAVGLTEDITASLAKFPGLSVVALQSARAYKGSTLDARQIAERMNARYILDGSVRKAGTALRVTAHVVDAQSAATLWSEHYDRRVHDGDIFTIQDDVTDHIVATVADQSGVLARSMVQSVRQQTPLSRSSSGDLVLRAWGFHHNPTAAGHAELRAAFEARLQAEPENPHLWGYLAHIYVVEHALYFNPLPQPLDRALRASRRAIEIDPSNQQGWETLALTSFYRGDRAGFHEAGERAIRLNPRNAHTVAWIGAFYAKAGEYDRGCALVERAMQINPSHPGWLHFTVFDRHFARGEYAEALAAARRVNIPEFMWMHFAVAAAAGQLGLAAEGHAAYQEMIRIAPAFADAGIFREFVTRWYWQPEMIEALIAGVEQSRQAHSRGAEVTPIPSAAPASDPGPSAFTVTILPFQAEPSSRAAAFAAGLTESIIVGLSRFQYLRVIARAVAPDAVTSGYTLQASAREASGVIRIVMQLSDAQTGASVWADTYDLTDDEGRGVHGAEPVPARSLFNVQDDLAATIVATIADSNGALVRSMAVAVRHKPIDALTPYEAVLRRFAYLGIMSPQEHGEVRAALEMAVKRAPMYAPAWAALAQMYVDEYSEGYNPRPNPLERARAAADKAIELDSASHMAHVALALIAYFTHDMSLFRAASARALALNPNDTAAMSLLGTLRSYAGEREAGLALCARARALHPHHPGIYWIGEIIDHYIRRDYEGALAILDRVNMPAYPNALMVRAALFAQLGRIEEGRALLREAEARSPGISDTAAAPYLRWFTPEQIAHIEEARAKLAE